MRVSPVLSFLAALVTAALLAPVAGAAESAGKLDLTEIEAKRSVKDVVLEPGARIAAAPKAVASTIFSDSAGRQFSIDTTVPGFDLAPAAAVLNSTYHKSEISKLAVHAIPLSAMGSTCGSNQAVACYLPKANGFGEIWFGADDSDWAHSLVHEYGHHVDNQIANLAQLRPFGEDMGCDVSGDGTRNWYFSRMYSSNTTDALRFRCAETDWDHLVAELFAEDYVVLNGIFGWQLTSAKPPNANQLNAMRFDLDNKLLVATSRFSTKVKRKKTVWRRFTTQFFSLTQVKVTGAKGRDFDIFIYPAKSNELWDSSRKRGRSETLTTYVMPGTWDIGITARRKTGVAKVEVKLR